MLQEGWDGRRASLEDQVRDPLVNPREHGLADHAALLRIIAGDPAYVRQFAVAFPQGAGSVTVDRVAAMLASYLRSLVSEGSAFDRFWRGRDPSALSDQA